MKIMRIRKIDEKNVNLGIPEASLRRLANYLSYLKVQMANGVECISSSVISRDFNLDSTLVTKDISYTSTVGKPKVGYDVKTLVSNIVEFLEFNRQEEAFLFGVGNLGKALLQYEGLKNYGLKIIAGFDVNPNKVNTEINGIKIFPLENYRNIAQKANVKIGIITTPDNQAQSTVDLMVAWGIKAIWNFTPQAVKVPEKIVLVNTSIYSDLAVIIKRLISSADEN